MITVRTLRAPAPLRVLGPHGAAAFVEHLFEHGSEGASKGALGETTLDVGHVAPKVVCSGSFGCVAFTNLSARRCLRPLGMRT